MRKTATRSTNQLSQEDFIFSYDVQVTFKRRQKKWNKRDAKTSLQDQVYCSRLVQSRVDTGPDLECAETGFEGDSMAFPVVVSLFSLSCSWL